MSHIHVQVSQDRTRLQYTTQKHLHVFILEYHLSAESTCNEKKEIKCMKINDLEKSEEIVMV